MKRSILYVLLTGGLGATVVTAQPLNLAESSELNRFGLSFRPGFNIQASFTGLGGFTAPDGFTAPNGAHVPNPGPNETEGSYDRTYNDGSYNLIDASGNVGHLTQNWGNNPAQPIPLGQDFVVMQNYSAGAVGGSANRGGDPQLGCELSYNRRLGQVGKCAWGLELAFNWTDVQIHDHNAVLTPANVLSDVYALGGVLLPVGEGGVHQGGFDGGGPLLSDQPTRLAPGVIPNGAVITGQRLLDASVYGLRVGPYLDVPVCSRVAVSFSGGLALAYVDSEFSFRESVTIAGIGTETHTGAGNRGETQCGYYLSGLISYAMAEQLNVFAGVQYQDVCKFRQTVAGETATLDLGKSIFMTLGLSWSF